MSTLLEGSCIRTRASTPELRALALPFAEAVAAEHGVPVVQILGRDRHRRYVLARHALWAILRQELRWSLPTIARACGCVDHTSVLHGLRTHETRRCRALGLEPTPEAFAWQRREDQRGLRVSQVEKVRRERALREVSGLAREPAPDVGARRAWAGAGVVSHDA